MPLLALNLSRMSFLLFGRREGLSNSGDVPAWEWAFGGGFLGARMLDSPLYGRAAMLFKFFSFRLAFWCGLMQFFLI